MLHTLFVFGGGGPWFEPRLKIVNKIFVRVIEII